MTERPNCYACQYRGPIPGDAHSECHHPAASLRRSIHFMSAALSAPAGTEALDVEFAETPDYPAIRIGFAAHGVLNGWATWPMNFDPNWLRTCSGWAPTPAIASPEPADASR